VDELFRPSLSQWRGYASNGEGFCIGFDRSALVALGKDERDQDLFSVIDVLYEPSEHQEIVAPIVKEAVDFAKVEIPNRRPAFGLLSLITDTNSRAEAQAAWDEAARRVREKLFPLFDHAWRLKPRAFHGEHEVRALVTELLSETHPLEFKNSQHGITFFREFGFNGRESSLIREIWIGPRNQTPIEVVKSLAKKIGAPDAEIKRSAASYR
jgi:hypothetical protein